MTAMSSETCDAILDAYELPEGGHSYLRCTRVAEWRHSDGSLYCAACVEGAVREGRLHADELQRRRIRVERW